MGRDSLNDPQFNNEYSRDITFLISLHFAYLLADKMSIGGDNPFCSEHLLSEINRLKEKICKDKEAEDWVLGNTFWRSNEIVILDDYFGDILDEGEINDCWHKWGGDRMMTPEEKSVVFEEIHKFEKTNDSQ